MASIVRSGTRRGLPVTMRLTNRELRLLLRAMHYAVDTNTFITPHGHLPMSEEVERLIAEMELFFDREKA
jgi:hypothetical protein